MIYVKIEPDGPGRSKCTCGIEGDLKTLTLHTIEAIHAIYNGIAEDSENVFEPAVFQAAIMEAVNDPSSSVWDRRKGVEM